LCGRKTALSGHTVGEARAHVQGATLKARALSSESFELPDHVREERPMRLALLAIMSLTLIVIAISFAARQNPENRNPPAKEIRGVPTPYKPFDPSKKPKIIPMPDGGGVTLPVD
jgi:hypothetical protein